MGSGSITVDMEPVLILINPLNRSTKGNGSIINLMGRVPWIAGIITMRASLQMD